jgi:hypothetical protein
VCGRYSLVGTIGKSIKPMYACMYPGAVPESCTSTVIQMTDLHVSKVAIRPSYCIASLKQIPKVNLNLKPVRADLHANPVSLQNMTAARKSNRSVSLLSTLFTQ